MTISINLPVFPGFNNTLYTIDALSLENECEYQGTEYDEDKINIKAYEKDVSIAVTKAIKEICLDNNYVSKMEYVKLYTPNYTIFPESNDVIIVNTELTDSNFETILNLLRENETLFSKRLKEDFTPYDGFAPFHSTNIVEWFLIFDFLGDFNESKKLSYIESKKLSYILTFLINDVLGKDECNIRDYVMTNVSEFDYYKDL